MADVSFAARRHGALDGLARPGEAGGVRLTAAGPAARFVLRGPAEAAAAAGAAFGLDLPARINTASHGAPDRLAIRLGPDEWLLVAGDAEPPALFAAIEAAVQVPHSLVDMSHRQTAILVEGPGAALALNAAVPLDLSQAAFPPGTATRTIFEKAEIVLWRSAPDTFRIEVWRSFAPYVLALLEEVRTENAAG